MAPEVAPEVASEVAPKVAPKVAPEVAPKVALGIELGIAPEATLGFQKKSVEDYNLAWPLLLQSHVEEELEFPYLLPPLLP